MIKGSQIDANLRMLALALALALLLAFTKTAARVMLNCEVDYDTALK